VATLSDDTGVVSYWNNEGMDVLTGSFEKYLVQKELVPMEYKATVSNVDGNDVSVIVNDYSE
jgi:hypothetical protein